MKQFFTLAFFIILLLSISNPIFSKNYEYEDLNELQEDLSIVLPLVKTVNMEYDSAMVQLEKCVTIAERESFMEEFEKQVKEKYFFNVIDLEIRQGRLLILLIHREMGETAFNLLKNYLSLKKANFWNKFAKLVGANLKEKYSAEKYPIIEQEIIKLEAINLSVLNNERELLR